MNQFKSQFLPSIDVIVVFSEDPEYETFEQLFSEYGYGFFINGSNMIIIDGEYLVGSDVNTLMFIDAHESSHIILRHSGPRNDKHEIEADLGAFILLRKKKLHETMELLVNEFENRHGIPFKLSLLNRVSKRMKF